MSFFDIFKHDGEKVSQDVDKSVNEESLRLPFPEIFEPITNNFVINKIVIDSTPRTVPRCDVCTGTKIYFTVDNKKYTIVLYFRLGYDDLKATDSHITRKIYFEQDNTLITIDTANKHLKVYQLIVPVIDKLFKNLVNQTSTYAPVRTQRIIKGDGEPSTIIVNKNGYTFNDEKLITFSNHTLKVTNKVTNYIINHNKANPITAFSKLFKNEQLDKLLSENNIK